jgi:hypothetical protein
MVAHAVVETLQGLGFNSGEINVDKLRDALGEEWEEIKPNDNSKHFAFTLRIGLRSFLFQGGPGADLSVSPTKVTIYLDEDDFFTSH